MALVAIALVAIIAMAALSIDVVTLFLAREEAQRAADAGALAAARVLSVSGLTGDTTTSPITWACICGSNECTVGTTEVSGYATVAAERAAGQSTVSGIGDNSGIGPGCSSSNPLCINVTYSANGSQPTSDCTTFTGATAGAFGVNPMVTVQVIRSSLPTFFSRIWGNTGNTASASATAEAFNPSFSASYSNGGPIGTITPVQPRCVKPLMVPNLDPLNPSDTCTGASGNLCQSFVNVTNGQITHPGVSLDGTGATGVIGENFWLEPDCNHHPHGTCNLVLNPGPPPNNYQLLANNAANTWNGLSPNPAPNLSYVPGQAVNPSVAVPSGVASAGQSKDFAPAVAGCDQTTVYQCGVQSASSPNYVDLSENPVHPIGSGDTTSAVMALIHQGSATGSQSQEQDYFNTYGEFGSTPYQILAGSNNPLVSTSLSSGSPISTSNSIVTIPIYDSTNPGVIANNQSTSPVTIVGFLQVFINGVDEYGDVNVTILNVAGCGNGGTTPVSSTAVAGSSPVPIRLITPP
jgi:hypothetical protein